MAKQLTPHATYYEILEALYRRHFPVPESDPDEFWRHVSTLSEGEQAFLLVNEMTGEVGNGGFGQYFDNTGYQRAHQTVQALMLIGATKSATFLRKAIEIAGIPSPLPEGYDYFDCDDEVSEQRDEALNALDEEYYDGFDKTTDLMVRFIQQHPEQFQ